MGVFQKQSLQCRVWSSFKSSLLPEIRDTPKPLRTILYIASGAGDWTALKNRSDEDLSFQVLVKAAEEFLGINFVHRPHPLWILPEHQGEHSIERLHNYLKYRSLDNMWISGDSRKVAQDIKKQVTLSLGQTKIDDEIYAADIVIGDHSQALLSAAQKGKIIVTLSCAKREEFFSDYTKLGFPKIASESEMLNFLREVIDDPEFLTNYNKAIARHNEIVS